MIIQVNPFIFISHTTKRLDMHSLDNSTSTNFVVLVSQELTKHKEKTISISILFAVPDTKDKMKLWIILSLSFVIVFADPEDFYKPCLIFKSKQECLKIINSEIPEFGASESASAAAVADTPGSGASAAASGSGSATASAAAATASNAVGSSVLASDPVSLTAPVGAAVAASSQGEFPESSAGVSVAVAAPPSVAAAPGQVVVGASATRNGPTKVTKAAAAASSVASSGGGVTASASAAVAESSSKPAFAINPLTGETKIYIIPGFSSESSGSPSISSSTSSNNDAISKTVTSVHPDGSATATASASASASATTSVQNPPPNVIVNRHVYNNVDPCLLVHPALARDCYRSLYGPVVHPPPPPPPRFYPAVMYRRGPGPYVYYPQVQESTFYFP